MHGSQIGNVYLRVRCDEPLLAIDNPVYKPFLDVGDGTGAKVPDIDVRVVGTPAPVADLPLLFESEAVWKVHAEAEGYRLSLYRIGEQQPHTVARSDAGTALVQVHVSRDTLPSESGSETLWNPVRYPLDQLLLMNHLASRGWLIAHAAGAVVNERAVVFPGRSGAGKSSIARLFMGADLGDTLLSDDRVVLRTDGESAMAWGTPWPGDAGIARNAGAPLAALFFLVKADRSALVPLDAGAAMRRLVPVVSGPWYDRERGRQVMATCSWLVERLPCFDVRFRLHDEVVKLITDGSWNAGD